MIFYKSLLKKKWLYKIFIGIGLPFLIVLIANPFSYKTHNMLQTFMVLLVFCIITAFFISKIERLFYIYESYKLYRIRKHFSGKIFGNDAILFSFEGIDVVCTLMRTSEANNFSKLKFNLPKKLVRRKIIEKFDFIVPTKIENTDFFQIHVSNGLFLSKLNEDLRNKITLTRRLNQHNKI